MNQELIDYLEQTKEIIKTKKWVNHSPNYFKGEVCLVTAINRATNIVVNGWKDSDRVIDAIRPFIPKKYNGDLVLFNDAQTDRRRIITVINKTIKAEKEKS